MATVWKFNDGTEYSLTDEQEKAWRRILKKQYKREHCHSGYPRWAHSMREKMCMHCDEDGEYWTEYGMFDGRGLTDDDIREILDTYRYIVNSPWDCTGQPTTCWLTWHRNPTGLISYIHRVGLDI